LHLRARHFIFEVILACVSDLLSFGPLLPPITGLHLMTPRASMSIRLLSILVVPAIICMVQGCGRGTPPVPSTSATPTQNAAPATPAAESGDTAVRAWVGHYSFDQVWETEGQDIKNIITYELSVHQHADSVLADVDVDGYMTSIHAHCTTAGDAQHLVVLFREVGEDNTFDQYEPGDTLFSLVSRGDSVLTYWGKMQPEENEVENGAPYFKRQ
jgi:hypothetical protein